LNSNNSENNQVRKISVAGGDKSKF
jgi:hypothetical protein